jgi:hypothetical protein
MAKHMIPFSATQDGDRELIDLAFSKKKADDRKEWLRNFVVRPGIESSPAWLSLSSAWDISQP